MDINVLKQTAQAMVSSGKGVLAADESTGTITKRFSALGIESTPESRLAYRQMLFTTPGLQEFISGVILYDETIRQKTAEGIDFPKLLESKGIIPGIKVDKGAWKLPNFEGEKITEGLDGLRDQLTEYKEMGAKFAKWRAVFSVGEGLPTDTCIYANAGVLARYAALCQEQDIVPIIEPEVLRDGAYDLNKCREATTKVLKIVFDDMKWYRVALEGLILKTNMVTCGQDNPNQATPEEVAKASIEVYMESVPKEVAGIVFLSGGQSPDMATDNLAAISKIGGPWQLSFSYGRALQDEAMAAWAGKQENVAVAQKAFYERCKKVSEARSTVPA